MKKLKILLLFSFGILFCIKINQTTVYNGNEKYLEGTITKCQKGDSYTKLIINSEEKIIIYYYDDYLCNLGDYVKIDGTLIEIENNKNFNLFNYKKYMKSKGIYWQMKADRITLIQKNKNVFYKIKNVIKERTTQNSYLSLFILGENTLESEIKESYQLNGVSHLFAISGMHVTLFITVLSYFLNIINKKTIINKIIIILFLLFYMFLTDFSISIVRASFLSILLIIKQLFNLKKSSLELFIYLFVFCICYNPYLIYQVGFQFTFLITFSFLVFSKYISKYKNYFFKLMITSCLAFIVSIPILINQFFEINFLTPFFNLFFIPIITFIIFPLSLITFLFPILIPLLEQLTSLLEQLSLWCNQLSIFTFSFAKPPFFIFILYYLIIYIGLYFFFHKKYYIVSLIPILFIHYHILIFKSYPTLTMLDVGQGDAILIQLKHNQGNILIDTGGSYYSNQTKNILLPFFKSIGIHKIDYLILTHGDFDHVGNVINLVENFKVDKVIFNIGEFNDLELKLIETLKKKNIKYYQNIGTLNIDKYKLYFLNTKEYNNENDNSSVIYTEINNIKMMFMGDAGIDKEKDILKKYNLNNIDILKVGHHGSNTSSSKKFIDAVNPRTCLISVGKNNRYGHPKESILEILDECNTYRTDLNGGIQIKLINNSYNIKTVSP